VADAVLPEKRHIERALRDAGLSARQAKRLLSGGWRALGADDDDLPSMLRRTAAALERLGPVHSVDAVESNLTLACDRDDPPRAPPDRSDPDDCA
jgi:hypothetical protein